LSLDTVLSRRSIRRYTDEPVSAEDLRHLLEAGMAAPSSRNRRPWHFVTVTDRGTLDRLAEVHPHGKMLFEATAAIAVCGDTAISPDYWVQDCSAATENILVEAAGMGLGTCWLGVHPREERIEAIAGVLGIPDDTGILSLIAVGHPAEEKEARTQYDESRVHRDKW
jgi:nitroreductase